MLPMTVPLYFVGKPNVIHTTQCKTTLVGFLKASYRTFCKIKIKWHFGQFLISMHADFQNIGDGDDLCDQVGCCNI